MRYIFEFCNFAGTCVSPNDNPFFCYSSHKALIPNHHPRLDYQSLFIQANTTIFVQGVWTGYSSCQLRQEGCPMRVVIGNSTDIHHNTHKYYRLFRLQEHAGLSRKFRWPFGSKHTRNGRRAETVEESVYSCHLSVLEMQISDLKYLLHWSFAHCQS